MQRIAVIGATGTIGRVVVPALAAAELHPVAVVRDLGRAATLVPDVEHVRADVTDRDSLATAVKGADGIVMVHASDDDPENVDYGAVPMLLDALDGARPHVVLMTSMAVTHATGSWRDIMHWKARGERVLRASGIPHTIIRPGWFDLEPAGFGSVVLEQGDRDPVDSRRGVARRHIADAIVQSFLHVEAVGATFELFSAPGDDPVDWEARFRALVKDSRDSVEGALDSRAPLWESEPARVRTDLERWRGQF